MKRSLKELNKFNGAHVKITVECDGEVVAIIEDERGFITSCHPTKTPDDKMHAVLRKARLAVSYREGDFSELD